MKYDLIILLWLNDNNKPFCNFMDDYFDQKETILYGKKRSIIRR